MKDDKELQPYDEVLAQNAPDVDGMDYAGSIEGDFESPYGGGGVAYSSEDPAVEDAASQAITTGDAGGGICQGCVNFDGQQTCNAFGGPLMVKPEAITACTAFRPHLAGEMPGEEPVIPV